MRILLATVYLGCWLAAAGQAPDPFAQGLASFQAGRYGEAERLFATSGDPRAAAFRALAQSALGRCEEARPGLEAGQAGGDSRIARLAGTALVQCLVAGKQYFEALRMAESLKQRFPADEDVLFQLARIHMRAFNETVYEMFRATSASYRVNQLSGEIFEQQGKYSEAVAEYRKAIEKNAAAVHLHYRLGRAILMESHTPEALENARQAFMEELRRNPNDAAAEYQIGQILLAQQKPEEAERHFRQASALDAKFVEPLVALGKLKSEAKQYPAAVEALEKAVTLEPANEAARYALMIAYRNAGRREDARKQKEELDKLQKPPEGEFSEFLKRLGTPAPEQPPQ